MVIRATPAIFSSRITVPNWRKCEHHSNRLCNLNTVQFKAGDEVALF